MAALEEATANQEALLRSRRRQTIIERPRVTRRFLEAAEYPIILIGAPAGFGKTTALKQFLARCENVIYIPTPPMAGTLCRFIHSFAEGCRTALPTMASPPAEMVEQQIGSAQELELYAAWAIANLRTVPCTIAIDDLHHTDNDPRIAAFLSRLTDNCGDQIQWLFSSRTQGLLPRAHWQAYAKADLSIDAHDLRMDYADAYDLAIALRSSATREQISNWVDLTRGFPIPLAYAIRASSRSVNLDGLNDGMRNLTFQFLADHLWETLSKDDRDLLELVAYLPSLNIDDYKHLSIDGAGARLASLSNNVAFVSLDNAFNFAMHDLFRDFVRQRVFLKGVTAHQQVVRVAIAFLFKAGRPIDALQLLIEMGEPSALLSAIESLPSDLSNLEIIPRLVAVIEREAPEDANLSALTLQADYWTRQGFATKALRYAEEILRRPDAKSSHLLCATRTVSIFTHYQSTENQRIWLNRIPAILGRLDKADYTYALAYQASYSCRFPELSGETMHLLDLVQRDLKSLDQRSRFEVLTINSVTFLLLDDEEWALNSSREAACVAQALDDPNATAKALNLLGSILHKRCDREFEAISEQLRQIVVAHGAWRFSQTSHWIPAEYYARCGDSERSLKALALFDEVILADERQIQWALYFRRISAILVNLINEDYATNLADLAKFGLPNHLEGKYEVSLAASLSCAFFGHDDRAAHHLAEARTLREKMTNSWQRAGVFDAYYGEVIALCSIGRWTQAKRLMAQYGGNSANTANPYDALALLSDGPPFVGVESALLPFAGTPFFGMLALLARRVIEKWSLPQMKQLLTAAETDVLRLIGLGKSNKDIANVRSRSTETVKRQVASLFRKLGVENRTSAVAVGRERGLL